MEINIGDDLICIENEYKNKVITDILISKNNTVIIIYKFWNQVGNIERCCTLSKLLEKHTIRRLEI